MAKTAGKRRIVSREGYWLAAASDGKDHGSEKRQTAQTAAAAELRNPAISGELEGDRHNHAAKDTSTTAAGIATLPK